MYLKRVLLKNLGPVRNFNLEPRFDEKSRPIPVVLVGQNGSGKSLAIATILDAVTEARRPSFRQIPEVNEMHYIKISSKNYVNQTSGYSHAHAVLKDGDHEIVFDEVVSILPYLEFEASAPEMSHLGLDNREFKASGFHKDTKTSQGARERIQTLSFLFFPHFRYERPYWMSASANIDFVSDDFIFGQARLNPTRTNIVEDMKRWILNVVLDRELYEKEVLNIFSDGPRLLGYRGPNSTMLDMVNEIVTAMLQAKDGSITSGRIGIGPKGGRKISVFATRGHNEDVVAPDIGQLSSGELMILGLATEIIRGHETATGTATSLDAVTGLVLIDEIDLHLHIVFQKSVLPAIIRKFQNVQFVLTTHSPFFLLGLAETGEVDIYNLPIGNKISAEEFSEFDIGYRAMSNTNEHFRERYQALRAAMEKSARPLIITEGKTDWQHLKAALDALRNTGYDDLNIDFLEFDDSTKMGDDKLRQMCEHIASIPQQRQLIFVFDRDNEKIVTKMSGDPSNFKFLGNNVYSLCLPKPAHRENYKHISIELLYKDDDLKTKCPHTGKKIWFTNEIEIISKPTGGEKVYRAIETPDSDNENIKKIFDQPADKIVDNNGNLVGLSKAAFVKTIVLNPDIGGKFDRSAFRAVFDIIREIVRTESGQIAQDKIT